MVKLPDSALQVLDGVSGQFSDSGKPVAAVQARQLSLPHVRPALARAKKNAKADQVGAVVVGSLVVLDASDLADAFDLVKNSY